jgi:hypothetical protein
VENSDASEYHSPNKCLDLFKLWISALIVCVCMAWWQPAHAEATAASMFRELAEVKAECQRVAKLHVLRPLLAVTRSNSSEKDSQALRGSERLYEALDDAFERIQKAVIAML